MSTAKKSVLLITLILLIDQITKLYIKLNFKLGESVEVFSWFQIFFIENEGMAFGMKFFGFYGKFFLSLFRLIAIGALGYYIYKLIQRQAREGYVLTVAAILAGAAGNLIDSLFYGLLFSESNYLQTAVFLPEGGGYAPLFFGKVVDMLYFPLIRNAAGETLFFSPVFNIADSAITVSVFLLLIFFRKDLNENFEKPDKNIADVSKR